jgi:hypothetical protein
MNIEYGVNFEQILFFNPTAGNGVKNLLLWEKLYF